jgi:hypothetical protein
MKAASYHQWPELSVQSFANVWDWLAVCETSCTDTALKWRACLDAIDAINPVPQMLVISGSHQHARQSIGGF